MVQMMREHVARGETFAFETTLADRGFARSIPKWQASGFRVSLWFLALASAEAAIDRVAIRVRQGGHFVPEDVIRRRFAAGRANFESVYGPLVDAWVLYDNSGARPALLDWGERR
jgi:predicted ABC-type ATPase